MLPPTGVAPFPQPPAAPAQGARPPHLTHDQLVAAHAETLKASRRRYTLTARILFATLDVLYGRRRTLSKFKVLELIARVPYQAWEQAAYVAITRFHEKTSLARRIYDRVTESRSQQDNEQWHLLILGEIIAQSGVKEGWLKHFVLPQLIAFAYYQVAWLMFVLRPGWSYCLNADLEDHAEHEYAHLVKEHPEWEAVPFTSELRAEYGEHASLADVFRQIAHDERVHKQESEAAMARPQLA